MSFNWYNNHHKCGPVPYIPSYDDISKYGLDLGLDKSSWCKKKKANGQVTTQKQTNENTNNKTATITKNVFQ